MRGTVASWWVFEVDSVFSCTVWLKSGGPVARLAATIA